MARPPLSITQDMSEFPAVLEGVFVAIEWQQKAGWYRERQLFDPRPGVGWGF